MGLRLHVAKKYEVEYDTNVSEFNWMVDDIVTLLYALSCDVEMYSCDNAEEFEVERSTFYNAIKMLSHYEDDEDIVNALKPFFKEGYTIDKLKEIFIKYYDAADPKSNYIHFKFI